MLKIINNVVPQDCISLETFLSETGTILIGFLYKTHKFSMPVTGFLIQDGYSDAALKDRFFSAKHVSWLGIGDSWSLDRLPFKKSGTFLEWKKYLGEYCEFFFFKSNKEFFEWLKNNS